MPNARLTYARALRAYRRTRTPATYRAVGAALRALGGYRLGTTPARRKALRAARLGTANAGTSLPAYPGGYLPRI